MKRRDFFAFLGIAPIAMVMAPKAVFSASGIERNLDQIMRAVHEIADPPLMEAFDFSAIQRYEVELRTFAGGITYYDPGPLQDKWGRLGHGGYVDP